MVSDAEVRAEFERLNEEYSTAHREWLRERSVVLPQECCGRPRPHTMAEGFGACPTCGSEYPQIPAPELPPTLAEIRARMEASS